MQKLWNAQCLVGVVHYITVTEEGVPETALEVEVNVLRDIRYTDILYDYECEWNALSISVSVSVLYQLNLNLPH